MTSAPSTRVAHAPSWFDSILFLVLMSGPPKFRGRDPLASLEGVIDIVVIIHVVVWTCGGLWVLARVYPTAMRRGVIPPVNAAQAIGALFIAALGLSAWKSPGILLTAFTLGQFAVMLGFTWVFTHRFGASACLRHLFLAVTLLALFTIAAYYLAPGLVTDVTGVVAFETRVRGDYLADTGSVAVIGLVFCLSSLLPLRGLMFWAPLSLFGVLLVASRTRSAYVAVLAFFVLGFIHGKRLRVRELTLPLTGLLFGVFVMDAITSTTQYLVREQETVATLSDRIPLWQYLTSVVMRESPITGLGYYAASRIVGPEYNPGLGNAHSAFFEVLVGGGILGAGLFLVLCATLAWFALHLLWVASGQPKAVAAAGLLVVALLMGLTTPAALHAGPLGFVFWSLTALLPELWREAARARRAVEQRLSVRQLRQRASTRSRLAS